MEFDQFIFKKIVTYLKRKRQNNQELLSRTVYLCEISTRLTLLSRALSGRAIEIIPSEREGGWKNNLYFLPESFSLYSDIEQNAELYLFRIFYLHIQQKKNFNWSKEGEKSVKDSQKKAKEYSAVILKEMFVEFPALRPIYDKLKTELPQKIGKAKQEPEIDDSWLYGRLMVNDPEYLDKEKLKNISENNFKYQKNKIETEIKAKPSDEVLVLEVDKKQQEEYVLTHNFEKVDTADEFDGVWRDFDGDDSLNEDSNALDELNLKHVVRVDDPVHSVYKAEFAGDTSIAESAALESDRFHYLYPEWDSSKNSYNENHCKVFPSKLRENDVMYYQNTLKSNRSVLLSLRKMFALMNNKIEEERRQTSGENIDLDAVIDMFADVKAKHTPDERLYLSKRKRKKELSLLFLLDLSLSSDGYAHGNRIIDVEKQVSILFGEVLNEQLVDFQIDGFYSKTRNNTSYVTLKAFDEDWHKAKQKIGAVQPTGYTRIGTALRHATAELDKRDARKKWLVLLSDGKPNDYDRYEGKYGIQDTKQALREMRVVGINNFAVAIEEQAKFYLPQMFGQNHYNILSSPRELISSLTSLYKRIVLD